MPSNPLIAYPDDARLLVNNLSWALRLRRPGEILRAPIFQPAPGQLLGTEVLASSLPLAAVFRATGGNAALAASGTALLTYPLAAVAMDALLLALGCAPIPAWTAGLLFALGLLRAPGNLQILQYPNFWLPLVALSLAALRSRSTPRRAATTAVVLPLMGLSSLYMAVMVAICAVAWFLFELARGGPGSGRYAAFTAAAAAAAAIPVGGLGWTYARHGDAHVSALR